ncbi:MAG: CBS domain-containing protein, partial [Candidatus Aminicenantes bacterium]|nr:CBS domain-containing protein [Candidatus Aminicenantes bacterium]
TGDLRKATQVASFSGRAFSFLLISIGIFEILQGRLSGLWLVFIGWFLHSAAVKGYQQVLMRTRLNNITAEDLMVEDLKTVPGHVTVQELVDVYILKKKERVFIVVDDDKIEGIVCLEDVKTIPRDKWKSTDVNEIMIPREEMEIVSSDTDGEVILAKLMSRNIRQVFVMDGNSIRGVISSDDIQRYMQLRSELDKKYQNKK